MNIIAPTEPADMTADEAVARIAPFIGFEKSRTRLKTAVEHVLNGKVEHARIRSAGGFGSNWAEGLFRTRNGVARSKIDLTPNLFGEEIATGYRCDCGQRSCIHGSAIAAAALLGLSGPSFNLDGHQEGYRVPRTGIILRLSGMRVHAAKGWEEVFDDKIDLSSHYLPIIELFGETTDGGHLPLFPGNDLEERYSELGEDAQLLLTSALCVPLTPISGLKLGRSPEAHLFALAPARGDIFEGATTRQNCLDPADAFSRVEEIRDLCADNGWDLEIDESWPFRTVDEPVPLCVEFLQDDEGLYAADPIIRIGEVELSIGSAVKAAAMEVLERHPRAFTGLEPEVDHAAKALIKRRTPWFEMPDGRYGRPDPDAFCALVRNWIGLSRLGGSLPAEAFGAIEENLEALEEEGVVVEIPRELDRMIQALRLLSDPPAAAAPAGFNGTLKPHQETGFGWLKILGDLELGGLLADEMGLGKSIQVGCLIMSRMETLKTGKPSLIIAPLSMLSEWLKTFRTFFPSIKAEKVYGPGEGVAKVLAKTGADVIITNYNKVMETDKNPFAIEFHAVDWDVIALDEAQTAKNDDTKTAVSIRKMPAAVRLVVSGTPIENNLGDLWTHFDWAVPNMLGSAAAFRTRFRSPIENTGDEVAWRQLNAIIAPFVLRRLKADVVEDLAPPEFEKITITLSSEERSLYETIRIQTKKEVDDLIAGQGFERAQMSVLAALTRLKQVCCDARLLQGNGAFGYLPSSKRSTIMDELRKDVGQGHRVLIFSQYTGMLDLLQDDIESEGFSCGVLKGSTHASKRESQIAAFQNEEIDVYLISLLAGGAGITLTKADRVYLVDYWWNPAKEDQAIARAHRIGQKNIVLVKRFVVERSIEEGILSIQERKRGLAGIIGPIEGNEIGRWSEDEIRNLLE